MVVSIDDKDKTISLVVAQNIIYRDRVTVVFRISQSLMEYPFWISISQ